MESEQLRRILAESQFLSGLAPDDQSKLAAIARHVRFEAGTRIFVEGSKAEDLYLLLSGRVELCMTVPARGCLPIQTLEAGDLLGWSAVIGEGEMTAAAAAVLDTEAIALAAAPLRTLCRDDHDVGYEIMRRVAEALSRRLVTTRLHLLDVFATSAPPVLGSAIGGGR